MEALGQYKVKLCSPLIAREAAKFGCYKEQMPEHSDGYIGENVVEFCSRTNGKDN